MKVVDLVIITPTLNEEFYIGKLLTSIQFQTVQPKEIIIVDAKSRDGTIKEIKKYQKDLPQLQFYRIPKYSISRQRNLGVKNSTAKKILFIDADMKFKEKDALENLLHEAKEKRADFAIPQILPLSKKKLDEFLYMLHNGIPKTLKPIKPLATTQCLFVKRSILKKAGLFDEEIKVGEDFELVSRLKKFGGKFAILQNSKIYSSTRRLEKDGRFKYLTMLGFSALMITVLGYKKNPVQKKYDFGNHPHLD